MNIGFDLDKVFIDYPFFPDTLVERLYKKKANGTLLYRIPTSKSGQMIRNFAHMPIFRKGITGNITFLGNIPKKDTKFYLVSSRYGFLKKRTENVLKKYGLDGMFDEMFFNYENLQPHLFKSEVIKKLKLDIYVDDDLALLKYVARHNKKTKFFWLNPKKKGALSFNITGITDLADILPPKRESPATP